MLQNPCSMVASLLHTIRQFFKPEYQCAMPSGTSCITMLFHNVSFFQVIMLNANGISGKTADKLHIYFLMRLLHLF